MYRRHLNWLCIFLLSLLIRSASPIKCVTCQSPAGDDACEAGGTRVTCTESMVAVQFRYLKTLQSGLTEPVRNTGYQCMKLRAHETAPLAKGCIFANFDLCATFPKAKTCMQCKEDNCNSKDYKGSGSMVGGSLPMVTLLGILVGLVAGHHG